MHPSPYLSSLLFIPFTLVHADLNSTITALEAQINPCTEPCAAAAISKSVCGLTDFTCQCQHASELNAVIVPCLQTNSTCSAGDIQTFESISVQICSALGVTLTGSSAAPTSSGASVSSNYTAAATTTGSPSGSASASASASSAKQAGAASVLDVNMWINGSFAIVGAGLMAMFM